MAQQAALHVVVGLAALTLAGLAVNRHRAARCYSFVAYLLVNTIGHCLTMLWPEQFFHWWFFVGKQGITDALKVGVALEIGVQVIRAFPGTWPLARRLTLLALIAATAAILWGPVLAHRDMTSWQPRVVSGTVWLFGVTALVVLWYRLPIHPWYRALLAGFTPYLFLQASLLGTLELVGVNNMGAYPVLGLFDSAGYALVMSWWLYSAWRPYPVPAMAPAVRRALRLDEA
jgi:hypothetical protein